MRVWEPCLQVVVEPVAVTKTSSKKEGRACCNSSTIGKTCSGEDRARLMEGGDKGIQLFNYWQDVFWGGQGEADGRSK